MRNQKLRTEFLMPSEVYYTSFGSEFFGDSILDRLKKLFNRSGAGSIIKENSLVAVKGHFGEPGNVSFVSPVYYRTVIDEIKKCGGAPFLAETNTLYAGERHNAVKHMNAAYFNGFSYATTGAPVIITDGLRGTDYTDVEINGKHVKKAKIASGIYHADSMVVMSHSKMHMVASYGGALKNLGMGCSTRAGKQEQHSGGTPASDTEKCTGCGECVDWCNENAIDIDTGKVRIDEEKCVGCGECVAVCKFEALATKWDGSSEDLQEKMVEYAAAAVKNKKGKCFYINFVINITPDCDCISGTGKYIVPDFGILASFDPVAIDAAAAGIIKSSAAIEKNVEKNEKYEHKHSGKDNFRLVHPHLDWEIQLDYAERLGLGTKDYELIEVK